MEKPSSAHVGTAKRILWYNKDELNRGILRYRSMGEISFNSCSNSDYAGDLDARRSTAGLVFTANGSAITWHSRHRPSASSRRRRENT